jgi:peptidoglycan/LPS O-acetylase OafA/YrhL
VPSSWAAERDDFAQLTGGGRVRHQPGLDGLRGLAVAAVVVFHTGLGWLPGGYLGVSLFFTISGVVIGTVILSEIDARGEFSLRTFWVRRARRLFPAAWVVLTVIAVLRVTSTVFASTSSGDLAASWLQIANWQLLAEDRSYAALFAGPSAVLHFWSLAIEEQFYLVVGAASLLLARRSRHPARDLGLGAGVLGVVSFVLPALGSFGVDRTYYGTDTRAGELLVGLVIAAVIAERRRRDAILRASRPIAVAAVGALVAAVVLWRVLDAGTAGLRTGVLPLSALLSSLLVAGALVPGPLQLLVRSLPLRRLGDISYALYLVHWPVFVAVRRADADPGVLAFAVATAVAVGLAVASTRLVEAPVRARRLPRRWLGAGAAALLGCTALALTVPARQTAAERVLGDLEQLAGGPTTSTAGSPAPDPRPMLGVFGDSVALSLALSLEEGAADARFALGPAKVELGCGVALSPVREPADVERCAAMLPDMAALVRDEGLDDVLVVSCQWELVAQTLPGDTVVRHPGDPVFDDHLRAAYRDVAATLRAAGAEHVLWVRCPPLSTAVVPADLAPDLLASRDPARVAATNAILDELAADGTIEVLDLAAWVAPRVDDATLRPDGSHFAFDAGTGVGIEMTRLVNEALSASGD